MSIRRGILDALTLSRPSAQESPRHLEASALLAPPAPAPVLASPWAVGELGTLVLSDIYGDQADDLPLTRAEAIAVPSVARARGVVAPTLGRLELRPVDADGEPVDNRNAAAFLANPDPHQARYVQVTWTVDDLIFYGVSWWQITARYATDNRPRHARRILPGGLEVHDGGRVTVYGKQVSPDEVLRIDGPHEGILNYAARSVRTAARLERSVARFADNPVPAIELHQTDDHPMTPAEKRALVKTWADARRGKDGGVAYTTRNIEVILHGAPAEHLLTTGRNAAAVDIARHVGVPADTIDATQEKASMTYANVVDKGRHLIDYGLAAYGAALEARLSMPDVLPTGTFARFAYGAITDVADTDPTTPAPAAPERTPAP